VRRFSRATKIGLCKPFAQHALEMAGSWSFQHGIARQVEIHSRGPKNAAPPSAAWRATAFPAPSGTRTFLVNRHEASAHSSSLPVFSEAMHQSFRQMPMSNKKRCRSRQSKIEEKSRELAVFEHDVVAEQIGMDDTAAGGSQTTATWF
jgi:hypothetical protein